MNYIIAGMLPHQKKREDTTIHLQYFPRDVKDYIQSSLEYGIYALIDCLLPSPRDASYLVVNAQSKVLPLPSHSQTPAAQPRLLSLVHASGRTPLKLRHKNSPNVQCATSPQCANSMYSSLSSCRECRYAGLYHSSVHVGAGCT